MLYLILRAIAIFLAKLFLRLQVFGQENIPAQGGFILACNHVSYLDPPVVGAACPRVLTFAAKEELFRQPLVALFLRSINVFPVKTNHADLRAIRCALSELKLARPVALFPEGGRTANGKLEHAFAGIGLLAAKSGQAIVPAFINGTHKALPVGIKYIRREKVTVTFGKPFTVGNIDRGLKSKNNFYQAIADKAMAEIKLLRDNL